MSLKIAAKCTIVGQTRKEHHKQKYRRKMCVYIYFGNNEPNMTEIEEDYQGHKGHPDKYLYDNQ